MASELGGFLRSCRARVRPADLGLRTSGARRVPGARREEIAAAAGVSPDYYTRIEQGRVRPSQQVLEALAHALRLNEVERDYLLRLSHRPRRAGALHGRRQQAVRPETLGILARFEDLPAVILGSSLDALAWTSVGAALLGLRPDGERNMARRVFLLAETRRLYSDWTSVAAEIVGHLRRLTKQLPEDGDVAQLVGELSIASRDFSQMWARHEVKAEIALRKRFNHPQAGSFELQTEVLTLPRDQQTLAIYQAAPGTCGADALTLLNTLVASGMTTPDHTPAGVPEAVIGDRPQHPGS